MRNVYPLEAARTLREQEETAAREELTRTSAGHEEARRAVEALEDARRLHHAETVRITAEEERAARRSVADVLRAQDWLARRDEEMRTWSSKIGAARALEREAAAAVERARAALETARVEREAVERHHETWLVARRRESERKDEDEADEHASRPRRLR